MPKIFKKTDISLIQDKASAAKVEFNLMKTGNIASTVIAVSLLIFYFLTTLVDRDWIKTNADIVLFKVTILAMILFAVLALISIIFKQELKAFRYIWLSSLTVAFLVLYIPYMESPVLLVIFMMGSIFYFRPEYTLAVSLSSFFVLICRLIYAGNRLYSGFIAAAWEEAYSELCILMVGLLSIIICLQAKYLIIFSKNTADEQSNKERELLLAGKIQDGLLSKQFPANDSYEISAAMIPSWEVGGDFYDFFPIDHSHVGLIIADVSDKGFPAALMMSTSKTVLKENIVSGLDFARSVEKANKAILENNKARQFITAFMCIVNIDTGKMSYINAGHNPPCLIHADGTSLFIKSDPNFVLGVRKKARYVPHTLFLEPGDKLFLYTDGIPEKQNPAGEYFGKERLAEILSENSSSSAETVIQNVKETVERFGAGVSYADDMTCLVFSLKNFHTSAAPLEIVSENGDLSICEDFILSALRSADLKNETVLPIVTSADEILSNIYKYAYNAGESKYMKVSVQIFDDTAEVTFIDRGCYFNPLEKVQRISDHEDIRKYKMGGMGINLVWKLMDDVIYTRKNNENLLTIVKQR